jgi:hypothetical protein
MKWRRLKDKIRWWYIVNEPYVVMAVAMVLFALAALGIAR